jgi:flagellar hook-associated protein 2
MPGLGSVSGLASGIPTDEIIAKIMAYRQRPVELLKGQRDALSEKLKAWQNVNARLLAVRMSAAQLASASAFETLSAKSSNPDALTATAAAGAPSGTYTLRVLQVARAHQLGSDQRFADTTTTSIGTGAITITNTATGAVTYVYIPEGAGHLEAVRDAINASGADVFASIVNDGSGSTPYRLLITSKTTGTAGEIQVSTSLTGGTGLSFTGPDSVVTAATNARVQIGAGGTPIVVESSTNTITTALPGLTLNVKSVSASEFTLTVSRDNEAIVQKVQDLAKAYNDFVDYVKEVASYDAELKKGGPLLGEFGLQGITSDLSGILVRSVSGLRPAVSALSSVGVRMASNGKLMVNEAELRAKLESDPSAVSALFARSGTATDPSIRFVTATGNTKESTGSGWAVEITRLATQTRVTAGAQMSGPLQQAETVTINGVAINLTAGMTLEQVVAAINARKDSTGVLASATQADGTGTGSYLTLSSVAFGSRAVVSAYSSVSALTPGSTGLGTVNVTGSNPEGETGSGTGAQGVDVEGTINGEPATGNGKVLTGNSGNATTDGLSILVNSSTTGEKGFVTYSRGVAAGLADLLERLTDPASGVLTNLQQGVQTRIDSLNSEMNRMVDRLAAMEERLRAQFAAMESSLSRLQSQSQYLMQAMASLTAARTNNRK